MPTECGVLLPFLLEVGTVSACACIGALTLTLEAFDDAASDRHFTSVVLLDAANVLNLILLLPSA